jgi:hypothetical protein
LFLEPTYLFSLDFIRPLVEEEMDLVDEAVVVVGLVAVVVVEECLLQKMIEFGCTQSNPEDGLGFQIATQKCLLV